MWRFTQVARADSAWSMIAVGVIGFVFRDFARVWGPVPHRFPRALRRPSPVRRCRSPWESPAFAILFSGAWTLFADFGHQNFPGDERGMRLARLLFGLSLVPIGVLPMLAAKLESALLALFTVLVWIPRVFAAQAPPTSRTSNISMPARDVAPLIHNHSSKWTIGPTDEMLAQVWDAISVERRDSRCPFPDASTRSPRGHRPWNACRRTDGTRALRPLTAGGGGVSSGP
jgi:hypothetical protein